MQNIKACFYVRPEDRTELERLVADGNTAQKITTRARIVLASGQRGLGANAIMQEARTSKPSVWRWQERHMEAGIRGPLKGKGKGKRAGAQAQNHYQDRTGKADQCHAFVRTMAKEMTVSHTTVQRIWKASGLKPHLTRTFKLSNDSHFAEKVQDIVGLYLNPPDKALCCRSTRNRKSSSTVPNRTCP